MGIFSKSHPRTSPEIDINSLVGDIVDRRRDALYDRFRMKAGQWLPSVISLFQTPVGQADPFNISHVKTFVDTNMTLAAQLSAPHEMIVRRFVFLFQPSADVDRNTLLANYNWEFKVLRKALQEQPLLTVAAQGSPEMLVENFGKGSWLEGKESGCVSNIEKLAQGVAWDLGPDAYQYLPSLVQFAVNIEGQPFQLLGDLDFYVMIDGLRDFPVQ